MWVWGVIKCALHLSKIQNIQIFKKLKNCLLYILKKFKYKGQVPQTNKYLITLLDYITYYFLIDAEIKRLCDEVAKSTELLNAGFKCIRLYLVAYFAALFFSERSKWRSYLTITSSCCSIQSAEEWKITNCYLFGALSTY